MSEDKKLNQGQEQQAKKEVSLKKKQELEAIKAGIRIKDLLDEAGIYYKISGNRLKAYSLKNDEKNPSLIVFLDKNRWKDFSYGQGGSVVDFYCYMYDVDLITAIKDLKARLYQIEDRIVKRPVKLNDFNQAKVEFMSLMHNYIMQLKSGKTKYLKALREFIAEMKKDITKELNEQMKEEMGLTDEDLQEEQEVQEQKVQKEQDKKIRGHIKREEFELGLD